ncbi:MAG: hypothetical protein IPJ69_00330 [Deltaproteobacteria bacterium]|nr:MAG: hypothetical protein IPJ69_00330 [Deltaproteobacteria bacterium]
MDEPSTAPIIAKMIVNILIYLPDPIYSRAEDRQTVLREYLKNQSQSPLPELIDQLVRKALSTDPDKRFQSVNDLKLALY